MANTMLDIDEWSLQYARKNVACNKLQSNIRLRKSSPDGPLIPLDLFRFDRIDFTMCNPPFYNSADEMLASAKAKQRPPLSACTGAEVEMVTPGGEVAFVTRMIQESLTLRERVKWYTSMLGKLSSVSVIVEKLKGVGVSNWAVTEFVQGSKTRRWGVAWSWGDMRPRMVMLSLVKRQACCSDTDLENRTWLEAYRAFRSTSCHSPQNSHSAPLIYLSTL